MKNLDYIPDILKLKPVELKYSSLEEFSKGLATAMNEQNVVFQNALKVVLHNQYQEVAGLWAFLYLLSEKMENAYGVKIDFPELLEQSCKLSQEKGDFIKEKLFGNEIDPEIIKQINDIFKNKNV